MPNKTQDMQEIANKRASMLYLSDAIRGEFQADKFNVIKAPCGSGKSYYAVNVLPNKVLGENPPLHKVLYLIDTINGRDGIIQSYPDKARGYDEMIDKNQNFAFVDCEKNKVVVITYAKFGSLIKRNVDFAKNFRLIIADEFHNIYWPIPADRQHLWNAYPLFSSKSIEIMLEENSLNLAAMKALLCAARNEDIMTVGISATPEDAPGWREWADMPFNDICVAENVRHYTEHRTVHYSNVDAVIRSLPKGEKTLFYATHIRDIKRFMTACEQNSLKCGAVWSMNNKDYPLSEEQLKLRDIIIKEQKFPDGLDVLLINKSMETSINIKTPVENVVVYSEKYSTQVQARGRIRNDIECFYVLDQASREVNLLDKAIQPYIGVPLDVPKKKEFVTIVGLKDKQGHKTGWTTLKKALIECGCTVSTTRIGTKNYDVVTLPTCIEVA